MPALRKAATQPTEKFAECRARWRTLKELEDGKTKLKKGERALAELDCQCREPDFQRTEPADFPVKRS